MKAKDTWTPMEVRVGENYFFWMVVKNVSWYGGQYQMVVPWRHTFVSPSEAAEKARELNGSDDAS